MKSCDLRHQLLLRQNKFFNISIGRKGKTIRTFMTATDQKGRSIAKTKSTPNGDNPVVIQHVEFSCESNTGNQHAPVILLHGLLGSKRNFSTLGTSLSRQLKKPRRVLAVDLRNHGDNTHDWRDEMSYPDMVDDLLHFLDSQNLESAVLVGHSMGGKVAQAMALLHPHRVSGLVVIDIAPVTYNVENDGGWRAVCQILNGLEDLQDLRAFKSKREVDIALRKVGVDDPALRAFVLTNVETVRSDSGVSSLEWKINLSSILNQIDSLAGFLENKDCQYLGDTFIISGGASRFVRVPHMSTISNYFPNHLLTTVRGVGHWVHAEAPDDTLALLKRYLDR